MMMRTMQNLQIKPQWNMSFKWECFIYEWRKYGFNAYFMLSSIVCIVLFQFFYCSQSSLNRFVIALPRMTFNLLLLLWLSFALTCCNVYLKLLWRNKSGTVWNSLLWRSCVWMEYTRCENDIKHFWEQLRLLRYRTLSYLTRFYIPLLLFRAIFLLILLMSPLFFLLLLHHCLCILKKKKKSIKIFFMHFLRKWQ